MMIRRSGLALSIAACAALAGGCKSKKAVTPSQDKAVVKAAAAGGADKPRTKNEIKVANKPTKVAKDPKYQEAEVLKRFGLTDADVKELTPKVELGEGPAATQLSKLLEASIRSLKGSADAKQAAAVMVGVMREYKVGKLHIQRITENQKGASEPEEATKKHSELKGELEEHLDKVLARDPKGLESVVVKFQRTWGILPNRVRRARKKQ